MDYIINLYCTNVVTIEPQLSGCSDYPDWAVTVQLEYFVEGVRFIRVFEWSFVHKLM